ncbi:MAG TPA: coproporphyrinogen III oxidase, partial [Stellaceae bacterium]
MTDPTAAETLKQRAAQWFETLRDRVCTAFEAIEAEYAGKRPGEGEAGRFERKPWSREGGGGGTIALMHGRVFEKVGVNVSTVWGEFSPEFRGQIPGAAEDPRFWASGISLVAHLCSPLVPAVHMNTRHIATSKAWFGGGADLTPMVPDETDTATFHAALKAACDRHDPGY